MSTGRRQHLFPAKLTCVIILIGWLLMPVAVRAQVTVPVVVHIVSDDPDAVTDAQIIAAIDDLNHAFAHTGPYSFGAGANTGIRFCLAKTDPDGGITTGITRTKSVYSDFDSELEDTRSKNLISWDNRRYANIWYVQGLKSEIYPSFTCGNWTRMKEAGYATFSNGGDFRDGIVVTAFGGLLAHEMGHYLGLKHTFTINDCTNNDCSVDGDGICDTPPQSVPGGSCTSPQNSCFTDTLSGFAKDSADMNSNFMGYSGCANMFTEGQAKRMRDNLSGIRSSLLAAPVCGPPCPTPMSVSFTRDNWAPLPGTTINFTATATGASNYQWFVDGMPAGTNSPALGYTFTTAGKYKVTLKVNNGDPSCTANYTHYVIVNCGVVARFYPDKRLIASREFILLDTILFTNRSVGATSYRWLMSNDAGMSETVVSTAKDLDYPFKVPAKYKVRLIASNGSCSDTTETMNFTVEDPTINGTVTTFNAVCFQNTKVRLQLYVCNGGYATIPKGTPISFYNGDPRQPGTQKVDTTFLLPDPVLGKCCGTVYTVEVDMGKAGSNTLYAVFNDKGAAIPFTTPNNIFPETNYSDNFSSFSGFRFTALATPPTTTLKPGDTLQLQGSASPGAATLAWTSTVPGLSCSTCPRPNFIAGRKDARFRLDARSSLGCVDSAFVDVKVPPADDLTLKVRSMDCYKVDSVLVNFEICNSFSKGIIPKGLSVSFYAGDPSAGGTMIGAPFKVPADAGAGCKAYSHVLRSPSAQNIFIIVNDKGGATLPNDSLLYESDYSNNKISFNYAPEPVLLSPADTMVLRNTTVNVNIITTVTDPASIRWTSGKGLSPDCSNCLSPNVRVSGDDSLFITMKSKYGCIIRGAARLRILPPDMTLQILRNECYTNSTTRVFFRICMNNGYDSVFRGIPVSFYGGDPSSGTAVRLDPVFITNRRSSSPCDTFSAIVKTPAGTMIYGVVNDKGGGRRPDTLFAETDLSNNADADSLVRFTVVVKPQDSSVYRNSRLRLTTVVSGGAVGGYNWLPAQDISCVSCPDPVVTVPYSREWIVTVSNTNACTASDTAVVKMYTDGPVNIPNAFTPNGDGKNDVFYVLGSKDIEVVKSFAVYDRYGQQVFRTANVPPNDPAFGWHGEVRSGQRTTASYVYAIVIRFRDGRESTYKGTLTLIR